MLGRDSLLVAIAFWLRFLIAAKRLSRPKGYRDQREDSQEQKNDLLITSIPFNKEVAIFDLSTFVARLPTYGRRRNPLFGSEADSLTMLDRWVEIKGFEPLAPALQRQCSTN